MKKRCKRCRGTGKVTLGKNRIPCPVCKRSKNPKRNPSRGKKGFPPVGKRIAVSVTFVDGSTRRIVMPPADTKQEARFFVHEAMNTAIHEQAGGKGRAAAKIESWMWDTEFVNPKKYPKAGVLQRALVGDEEYKRLSDRRRRAAKIGGLPYQRKGWKPKLAVSGNPGLLEGVAATAMTVSALGNLPARRRNPMRSRGPIGELERPAKCEYCGARKIKLCEDLDGNHVIACPKNHAEFFGERGKTDLRWGIPEEEGGYRGNPQIRPRVSYRGSQVRPRMQWHEPDPHAYIGSRSPFKGKLRGTLRSPHSQYQGLRYNPMGKASNAVAEGRLTPTLYRNPSSKRKGYSTAAKSYISRYISRHSPKSGRMSPSTRGKLLAAATASARSKGLIKSASSSKKSSRSSRSLSRKLSRLSKRYTASTTRRSASRSRSKSMSRSGSRPASLQKIYDHMEGHIYARGSVNSGTHGITKSTKFKHKVTSSPAIYGVKRSGPVWLPSGALVIKGKKRLFGTFGSGGSLSGRKSSSKSRRSSK